MQETSLEEFVRYIHERLTDDGDDGHFAFFLGAGCSISSGIPGAATLVRGWLPRLYERVTGKAPDHGSVDAWATGHLDGYDPGNLAKHYAPIMRELFPHPPERQREIERIVSGEDPGFGHAVLAQLLAHKSHGPLCNVVLTTNFDDLIADALYLFTRTKPVVVTHDSLARFVDAGRKRPNVIKLHGDAMFEPKNTSEETDRLGPETRRSLEAALKNRTLIINGYGGNDRGIAELFDSLEHDFVASGAYWVTDEIPDTDFGRWFQSCPHAVWVPHRDFDQLMLLIRDAFDLPHPEEKRFQTLLTDYNESFSKLSGSVDALPDESDSKSRLVAAAEKAASQFTDWWSAELAARKHKRTDPDEADRIYREGVDQFAKSPGLLGNYANFLADQRHEFDRAETFYRRALEADPDHANNLGNYANLLANQRRDFDRADAFYRRALDADPDHANTLSNYATFLAIRRGDFDQAETFYRRALDADPDHAGILGNYAAFLAQQRQDFDQAETFFKRSLEADPKYPATLGAYANFLADQRHNFDAADTFYRRALDADPGHASILGNYANFLANQRHDFDEADTLYRRALDADPDHASILGSYANFLAIRRGDFDQAETFYRRALDADPDHANNLGNYGGFALAGGDLSGFDLLRRCKDSHPDPDSLSEVLFYEYAHGDATQRAQALAALRPLIADGARSPDWSFGKNIDRAKEDEHPNLPFLQALADVINNKADALPLLDVVEEWKSVGSPDQNDGAENGTDG